MKPQQRKTRPDSPLRNLPEDRQAAIIAMMEGPQNKSFAEIKKHLASDGLRVSENALSEFRSWYLLRRQFKEAEQSTDTLVELLKLDMPELSEEKLFRYGQLIFSQMALKTQDPAVWTETQKLNLKKEEQRLQERRIAILEKKAAQADAARDVATSKLTPEEKEQRMKSIFGLS